MKKVILLRIVTLILICEVWYIILSCAIEIGNFAVLMLFSIIACLGTLPFLCLIYCADKIFAEEEVSVSNEKTV